MTRHNMQYLDRIPLLAPALLLTQNLERCFVRRPRLCALKNSTGGLIHQGEYIATKGAEENG